MEQIADSKGKRMEGISDLRDESDKDGVRVVIELKRDATPEVVLNQLHKYTSLKQVLVQMSWRLKMKCLPTRNQRNTRNIY